MKKKSILNASNTWISIIANLLVIGTFTASALKDKQIDRLDIITIVVLLIYATYNTFMIRSIISNNKEITEIYHYVNDVKFNLETNVLIHFYTTEFYTRVKAANDNESLESYVTKNIIAQAHNVNLAQLKEEIKKFFPQSV